ncbi:phage tail protein [Aggregatibacter kilianii]|uniref:phage tail protein n=1 Tax=Aggregatibacter kilianii TaxID=2025884 RepID=UPI000D64FD03|nr:phage tail protein [Aggregatibacter kilianii]
MIIKLPFWMDKGELAKIAALFGKWWDYVQSAVKFPFEILDEEKCSERILNLIAYQRDVERFENEPLELFRKRVKYAFINAKDAGSKAGFIRIFDRLGIGYVELEERFDLENWDVIKIRLTDKQLAKNIDLLNLIIRKYGRTCRRYTFDVITAETVTIHHGEFEHDYQSFYIKYQ